MNCPSFLPSSAICLRIDARREVDVAGHVPRLARLVHERRRDRPAAEQIAGDAALVAIPRQLPYARGGDAVLALREVRTMVLQERHVVDIGVADARRRIRAVLGPPRHPRVAGVDGDAPRQALVGHELKRVVLHRAQVDAVCGEAIGRCTDVAAAERRVRPRKLEARQRLTGEAGGALEAWHIEERVRQQLIAEAAAATEGHVALCLERRRGFVESNEVALDVVAAAAGVRHVERDADTAARAGCRPSTGARSAR